MNGMDEFERCMRAVYLELPNVVADDVNRIARGTVSAALDRAEAAEAEVERLREQMIGWMNRYEQMTDAGRELRAERDALQARLDAVIALCDEWEAVAASGLTEDGVYDVCAQQARAAAGGSS